MITRRNRAPSPRGGPHRLRAVAPIAHSRKSSCCWAIRLSRASNGSQADPPVFL